ncbi:hypothetical protein PF005_g26830 [Phytophthora fragariae]|uniref:Uncharacterized protein n=1 Tax=Phytophthora fragariae TaxID=53985 RepID=A0A6A3DWZ5_9STRA|nr:hypothetical protein PF003_g7773 [Phytophthora fragariae]KAE8923030.1 hypothetical protein PF009_g26713 [Phytophthora fragariae]KAE9070629.1 hypothetical protein PF010_g26188 [Phytophthora fragariae]KAE9080439.1 hypothetical protein PF006_g27312 [Phytophthora fragariae]KAE9172177.1 hypothetical protein PF005_g26830 [Phytophthora fragariae]
MPGVAGMCNPYATTRPSSLRNPTVVSRGWSWFLNGLQVSVASLLVLCRIVPNPQPKPLEGSPQTVLELVKLLLWPM